jgi:hypothetical protein
VSSCSNGLPQLFRSNGFSDQSRREQAEKLFDSVRCLMRTNRSRLFEIARVLVRLNHVARFVIDANHSAM